MGDMRELGEESQYEHELVAQKIIGIVDYLYMVGPQTRQYVLPIIQEKENLFKEIRWFDGDEPNKKDCRWIGDYYVLPVKRIKQFDYTGKVYNFEVDRDHSYVANNLIVHNCIVGVDDESTDPYAIILNSWGDAHGRLKDFNTNEDLPIGVLRVRKRTIQNIINAGETFAYSNFEGFPEQPIEKELFKLI
jgi:hypothetical protein